MVKGKLVAEGSDDGDVMNWGLSYYLDMWRVAAALVVVGAHAGLRLFWPGGPAPEAFGGDAVIVFFVISGFVISRAARAPGMTARRFVFDRATRLWSVAAPALVLTLALDALGSALYPAAYAPFAVLIDEAPLRAPVALLFAGEWGLWSIRIGTNWPWWSLSYEAAYYALFAAAVFLTGLRRVVWLVVGAALFGPKILILAPAWLLGVIVERHLAPEAPEPLHAPPPPPARPAAALATALAAPAVYAALVAIDLNERLLFATEAAVGETVFTLLAHSRHFIWDWIVAALFAAHLVSAAQLRPLRDDGGPRRRSWFAGATFSIYLTHFPVIVFAYAAARDAGFNLPILGCLAVAVVVGFVFAEFFERPLPRLRRILRGRGVDGH